MLVLPCLLYTCTMSNDFFSEEELSQGMVRATAQQSVIASRELQRVDAQQGKIFFNSLMSSFASITSEKVFQYDLLFCCSFISVLVYAASLFTTQVDLPLRKTAAISGINGYKNSS